jgi:hypothetical protein
MMEGRRRLHSLQQVSVHIPAVLHTPATSDCHLQVLVRVGYSQISYGQVGGCCDPSLTVVLHASHGQTHLMSPLMAC